MNKNLLSQATVLSVALAFMAASPLLKADDNLVENGDFEKGSKWPAGWGEAKDGSSLEKEDDNHFVRLVSMTEGVETTLYCAIHIKPDQKAFELSYRVRVDNLKVGKEGWFDARIVTNFKDESGEGYPSPAPVFFRKDAKKWVEKSIKFTVPEGATKLEIIAGLFRVETGTMDIDDIVLKPIDPASVK